MGYSHLQNGCQLHHHTADSVLTSGCSFIGQQIWNEIFIALAILGICIKIEKWSIGKRSMYIHISRWHTFDFRILSWLISPRWHTWHSGWRSCRSWRRCTHSFTPTLCLQILLCAILARKAAVIWFSQTIDGYLSITAFTFLCPGNSTLYFCSSLSSTQGFLIMWFVSSIAACKTLLWLFWPYSTHGACWTVLAVPDLVALP